MSEKQISVRGLVKAYGSGAAVSGVEFEVERGEIYGLLGPNGAGKTTTLECLEGLRRADGGSITVAGCNPQKDRKRLRSLLGVQLQSSSLPDHIRVDEAMKLVCAGHGVKERFDLLAEFGMTKLLAKRYHQLSTGQKRRLHLALALVSDPSVVILDEPTAGLDAEGRAQLHEEMLNLKKRNKTILLATHDMAEAEKLCDRISNIIRGKVAVTGTPAEVTAASAKASKIAIRTARNQLLGYEVEGAAFNAVDDYGIWIGENSTEILGQLLERLKQTGDSVLDLRVERPSLEESFLELVERGQAS